MRQTLKKSEILRGHRAYRNVLDGAKVYTGRHLKIFILHTSGEIANGNHPKVGFAVRRIRSAVIRNRMKRLMREVVRRNKELLHKSSKENAITHILLMCSSITDLTANRSKVKYVVLENEFRTIMNQMLREQ